ncbi:MAG: polymer-forming cytoskeletal protein [Alphaproteobacteria bacterium]|nr:MAG: polymer-forming cytoskeletal protein [Alphaproteobacteria bacterium]
MFQRRSNKKTPKTSINKEDASSLRQEVVAARKISPTIIASDVRLLGNIIGEGVLDVDAQVEGNITASVVYIRVNGMITGDIVAQSEAHIFGSVHGVVRAQRVCIYPTAHIEGVVIHRTVMVEDGAYINAQFKPIEQNSREASNESGSAYMALLQAIQAQPVDPAPVYDANYAPYEDAHSEEASPEYLSDDHAGYAPESFDEDRIEKNITQSIPSNPHETMNTIPVSSSSTPYGGRQKNTLLHADDEDEEYNILKGLKLIS